MTASTPNRDGWRRRLSAASVAQGKYLWLLLVLGVFYWIVHTRAIAPTGKRPASLSIPVLDTPLPTLAVWASAPAVLFFVMLVILGTLRAYRTAEQAMSPAPGDETTDEHPNAIDWATYTTEASPQWIKGLLGFSYPLYTSIFAGEAAYLLIAVARSPLPVPGRWPLVALSTLQAVPVLLLLFRFWVGRYRRWSGKSAA